MQERMETRTLKAHESIIFSVIEAQAGTISKAFLELVMNSIDANATYIKIDFDAKSFSVEDNGKGFNGKEEIIKFFETFGTPHVEGDAKYGRFRMGRGQIMAFSSNVWETDTFKMEVDIKKNGLEYDFTENLKKRKGVGIIGKFYESLNSYDFNSIKREISDMVKYAEIDIIINGSKMNKDLSDMKWTIETEDYYLYINNKKDKLEIFNMGVKVKDSYNLGIGGLLVSKNALKVNFARNDILVSKCDIWKKFKSYINKLNKDNNDNKIKKKRKLNDRECENVIESFLAGEYSIKDFKSLPIFADIYGKPYTINKIIKEQVISVGMEREILADKVSKEGLAFVLNDKILNWFNVETVKELKEAILDNLNKDEDCYDRVNYEVIRKGIESADWVELDTLTSGINRDYIRIPDKSLTLQKSIIIKALNKYNAFFYDYVIQNKNIYNISSEKRVISYGKSDLALAWTNGCSYIVITEELIRESVKGLSGLNRVGSILLHEYLHDEESNIGEGHSFEFYEAYHNITSHYGFISALIEWTKRVNNYLVKEFQKNDLNVYNKMLECSELPLRKPTKA